MTTKLKYISEKSWLVFNDTEDINIGLLTENMDNYSLMIKGEKKKFLNRKEVNSYFNENVFDSIVDNKSEPKQYYINGYPVNFNFPNEVILVGTSLPLFSKKKTGTVYYCAGYYCLRFSKTWMVGFCPKYSTLQTYEYFGPFKTEFEAKSKISDLRRKENEYRT